MIFLVPLIVRFKETISKILQISGLAGLLPIISMVQVGNRADRNRPFSVQSSAVFFALEMDQCSSFIH